MGFLFSIQWIVISCIKLKSMETHYIVTNRGITSRPGKDYIPVNAKEYIRVTGDGSASSEHSQGCLLR
jgi:hypothetical protein